MPGTERTEGRGRGSDDPPGDASTREERIREALIELVGRHGYDDIEVGDVCDRAGVSLEDFEGLFSGKRDCLEKVWEAMTRDYVDACRAAFDARGTWRDGLRAAGYAALEWLFVDEARTRFFLIEVMSGGEMVRAHRDLMMNEFIDMLDAGRFEMEDPEALTRQTAIGITGSIYDNAIRSIQARESLPEARQRVKAVMYAAVLPYLGPEAAAEELEIPAPGED